MSFKGPHDTIASAGAMGSPLHDGHPVVEWLPGKAINLDPLALRLSAVRRG